MLKKEAPGRAGSNGDAAIERSAPHFQRAVVWSGGDEIGVEAVEDEPIEETARTIRTRPTKEEESTRPTQPGHPDCRRLP
jgi:hypothetical protein